jgi:hypothetical protein
MENPAGSLYRADQTEARRHFRPTAYLPARPAPGLPHFEPALAPALESLTDVAPGTLPAVDSSRSPTTR